VSLLALAAMPRDAGVPGAPALPVALALSAGAAVFAAARGRMLALVLGAGAGVFAMALAARTWGTVHAAGLDAHGAALELAPVLAASAALAALVPMTMFARRLPEVWKVLAPELSPRAHQALVWLTVPVVAAVAAAVAR
jgi:hypothetical protein